MIQDIEELCPELDIRMLCYIEAFEERKIHILGSRSTNGIPVDCATRPQSGIRKSAGIEIGARDTRLAVRITGIIGTLRTADIATTVRHIGKIDCVCCCIPVSS